MEFIGYQVGRDTAYLEKYGFISKGTMILNETKFVERLNKKTIEEEILTAINERK